MILVYNPSTNGLLYFMLLKELLNIEFYVVLMMGTFDVLKFQINCSVVVPFSTL